MPDLTKTQKALLAVLNNLGGICVLKNKDLAQFGSMSEGSVSRAITCLEALGLIKVERGRTERVITVL